jgi:CMP-N,N'-diacetyllegionaminic acid synthase
MKILGIIPARVGSTGVPNKNLIGGPLCAGKPLIQWTMEAARDSKVIDTTVVSTSDTDTLEAALEMGLYALPRPTALEAAESPTEDMIEHTLESIDHHRLETIYSDFDIIVLLQLTSPLRSAQHIDEAMDNFIFDTADSLASVVSSHAFLWHRTPDQFMEQAPTIHPTDNLSLRSKGLVLPDYRWENRPRRQDVSQFEENGAIYIFTIDHWRKYRNRLGGKMSTYEMSEEHRIQVDSPFDLWMTEQILLRQHALVC